MGEESVLIRLLCCVRVLTYLNVAHIPLDPFMHQKCICSEAVTKLLQNVMTPLAVL